MKYNFVYITTNLINGKQYIGDHSSNLLNDGYLGSGRPYFKNAIKEYGKENFKREILEFFDTREESFSAQEKYINEYNTLAPNGYNLSPKGGSQCNGGISEETKQKMKKPKTEEHKKHMSEAKKGIRFSKTHLQNIKKYARNKTDEHKKHISEAKQKNVENISGKNNPMFGKSIYDVWFEKKGKEFADKRLEEYKQNMKKIKNKKKNER